jgi:hypothetical protein
VRHADRLARRQVVLVLAGSASPAGSPAVRRVAMASASARDRSPTMLTVAPRAV